MTSRPTLTLIVPCFNAANTVEITLRSVLGQRLREIEVLAIDDCSSDDTHAVLEEAAERDPRVRVIRHQANQGIGSTRTEGMRQARGEFITFVDADDWVSRGYHFELVQRAVDAELDFIRADHVRFTTTSRTIMRAPELHRDVVRPPSESIAPVWKATMVDYPYSWAGVLRRSFIESNELYFPAELATAEDRPWIWRLFMEGQRYQTITECGYFYRQENSSSQLTQIGDVRQLDFFPAMNMVLNYLELRGAPDLITAKAYRTYLAILASQYGRRDRLASGLREELEARARGLGRRFESRILHLACDGLDEARAKLLSKLIDRDLPYS